MEYTETYIVQYTNMLALQHQIDGLVNIYIDKALVGNLTADDDLCELVLRHTAAPHAKCLMVGYRWSFITVLAIKAVCTIHGMCIKQYYGPLNNI